jgi:GNAT superfamily N-acetyltransferase
LGRLTSKKFPFGSKIMAENIVIRGYQEGDWPKILEVLKRVFDGWPQYDTNHTSLDTLEWKFGREVSKKTLGLAEDKGKIVGTFLTWVNNIKIGETMYQASNGCDVAVHPDYRGYGLFNKVRDFVGERRAQYDIKVHLGISGNALVIESYKRNTEKYPKTWINFPYQISRMIMITDVDQFMKKNPTDQSLLKGIAYRMIGGSQKLEVMLTKFKKNPNKIKIEQVEKFNEDIDSFWNRIRDGYDYILERKKDYLNWRYTDPRAGSYRIIQAEEEGKIIGYSVQRINRIKRDNPRGYIVELLAEPERMDVVDTLLGDAMNYFQKEGINAVYSSQFDTHPYNKIYKKYGFVTYAKSSLFLWLLNDLGKDLAILKNAKVNMTHFANGDEDEI